MSETDPPRRYRHRLVMVFTAVPVALTAGCSGSELEVSDDSGLWENVNDDEPELFDLERANLELTSVASDNGDGTFTISGALISLDTFDVAGPTITVEPTEGVELVPVPAACQETDAGYDCFFADYLFTDGPLPTDPEPFEFTVAISPSAVDPSITLTATSSSNPVDNDPDPTNNIVTHDLDVN